MPVCTFDQELFLAIATTARSNLFAMSVLNGATLLGEPVARVACAVAAVVAMLFLRRRRDALFVFVAVLASTLLCALVKDVVARPRPHLLPHLDHVTSWSFPSGHAWNGLTTIGGIAWVIARGMAPRPRGLVLGGALLLIVAMGISRIALGVHWPSDIIAGWAGGLATLFVTDRLIKKVNVSQPA